MTDLDQRRGVIFDLDGVLIDSFDLHQEALVILAAEFGVDPSEAYHKERFGTRTYETLRDLLPGQIPEPELLRLVAAKEDLFRELAQGRLVMPPGALDLIRGLAAAGFRLAIGSSTVVKNLEFVVEELQIGPFFEAIISGEDVAHGKPHPDIFLLAAEKLGLGPRDCVVVEDAVPGVEAARRAGIAVIAVTASHPAERLIGANRIVNSLALLTPTDFAAVIDAAQS